jgi:peptide/nickel transport system ATP-binding protein/oligopeptide transport system ATP-binding protein
VGESGSGKSVTLLSILRLIPHPGKIAAGEVRFQGERLSAKSGKEMRQIRGKEIAMIFQDPMTTLNPAFRVGDQIRESLRIHQMIPQPKGLLARLWGRERRQSESARVLQAMADVEIPMPRQNVGSYPHQFSGGMQQRVLSAIALSCEPKVLLADEPTTALDVTIQAQIMALLDKINQEHGTAIVLVTHNLGLVAEFCETIIVLYAGQLMEKGQIDQVIEDAKHPYTQGLLRCLPKMRTEREKISPIPGLVPDLAMLPKGCPFGPRCDQVMPQCSEMENIPIKEVEDNRLVRCLLY